MIEHSAEVFVPERVRVTDSGGMIEKPTVYVGRSRVRTRA